VCWNVCWRLNFLLMKGCPLTRFFLIALIVVVVCGLLSVVRLEILRTMPPKDRFYWVVAVSFCAVYGVFSCFLPERLRSRRLAKREKLPFNDIYNSFLNDLPITREKVEQLWVEIACALNLDPGLLRPADRLSVELACKSFPLVDLSERLEFKIHKELKAIPRGERPKSIATLRDCIVALGRARGLLVSSILPA
jgi:hypothetical protein